MDRKAFWKLAASSLIMATTMAGCSGASLETRAGANGSALEKQAAVQADLAEKAIRSHKPAEAVEAAEVAVQADPDNAAYRALLGRTYLMAGRYVSAQAAFEDAMTLGNRDPRTIVSLSLVKTAKNQTAQARDLLFANIDVLPAADYGLAMAMAGDTNEAIRVLSQAIHDTEAGAKERQNLAYSYALAGRWSDAKTMASQDLGPMEAAKRVMGWAAMAQAGAESERVIAMVGVRPLANDAGQPTALALNAALQQPVEVASIEPQPEAPAEAAPAPVEVASAPAETRPVLSHILHAPIQTIREAVIAPSVPARAKPTVRPVPQRVSLLKPVAPAQASAWVVQLGAYNSAAVAKDKWSQITSRSSMLAAFPIVTSAAKVNGREYHRLSVAGFGNRNGAETMCRTLRAQGRNCFVRQGGGAEAEPGKWAMAGRGPVKLGPVKLATR